MSSNKVNKTTGELVTLANGMRCWIGTKAAHDAAVQTGTMPNNCLVAIIDDWQDATVDVVEDGNMHPVTSNAVYDATQYKTIYTGTSGMTLKAQLSALFSVLQAGNYNLLDVTLRYARSGYAVRYMRYVATNSAPQHIFAISYCSASNLIVSAFYAGATSEALEFVNTSKTDISNITDCVVEAYVK